MNSQRNGAAPERVDFSKIKTSIPIPNLIEVQRNSYERFLQMDLLPNEREDTGLQTVFNSVFPISDFRGVSQLEFVDYSIGNWECKCGNLKGLHHLRSTCRNPSCGATIKTDPFHPGDVLCQILPSGSGFEDENNLKLFTALIHAARKKLVITNPYFIPDDALMTALTSAAQRGVDVTLVNSEASDQFLVSHAERSYYEDLLKAGVKLYRYKAPILLHSKHITIDDDIAVIGSSNMDIRSFLLNLEVTLICYAPSVVADLRQVEARDLSRCNEVNLEEWETRSTREKFYENISRLTAAVQ